MKVVVGSDEKTALTDAVGTTWSGAATRWCSSVLPAASPSSGPRWASVGELVAKGDVETGVLFCWTGTGASIAARTRCRACAALCTDAATAAGARKWNDANVLVMGLRLTTPEVAGELLDAWFATVADPGEADNIARLESRQ
jgi:ribose 5-phosphate isomerase B